MRKYRILQFICGFMMLLPFITACSDDKTEEIDGIFRPKIVNGYPLAVKNTVKLLWYDIEDAESYDVQVSRVEDFSKLDDEQTTKDLTYTTPKLPYDTKVYLRVRANSKRNNYVSEWREIVASTDTRDVPQILNDVDDDDITETDATVRWKVDAAYPFDQLTYISVDDYKLNPDAEQTVINLSEEDAAKGYYKLTGLTKTTEYYVTLLNSKIDDEYERAYNTVAFKTAGPPADATIVTANDDLAKLISDNESNASIAEGHIYYIQDDGTYELNGFEFSKGFSISGAIGKNVKININSHFTPKGYPGALKFTNVELTGVERMVENGEDDGLDYIWDGLYLSKCTLSGFEGGLIKINVSKGHMKEIKNINIDKCIFDNMLKGKIFDTNLSDNSTQYLALSNVSITNTTFINSPELAILFLHDAYGQAGGIISFKMTNVTAYESLSKNGRVIQMNKLTNESNVLISNCLFSDEENTNSVSNVFYEICIKGSAVTTYADNYMTGELDEAQKSKIGCIKYEGNRSDLFANPAAGDLTIKDHASDIYTKKVGDPRWLK